MKPTDEVPVPKGINAGLSGCGNKLMLSLLGNPRNSYAADCRPVTNAALSRRIVTENVGPFRVTGFDLAVADLHAIFAEIKVTDPMAYAMLGTAGMLCCRLVRGSKASISNHSWGTAIDLTINRVLDERGDDKVQVALTQIAPVFHKYGWFWGAGFSTEDAMHFEVSAERMTKWKSEGKL